VDTIGLSSSDNSTLQSQIEYLDNELKRMRNELAMTKQDLQKSQMAVATAVNLLRSVGGEIVKINLLQSEAQGISAQLIKGIEKVLSMIPQQQQQNEQQQQK
jgi:uncharacterized protein YegL